jgi:hypothetical protein
LAYIFFAIVIGVARMAWGTVINVDACRLALKLPGGAGIGGAIDLRPVGIDLHIPVLAPRSDYGLAGIIFGAVVIGNAILINFAFDFASRRTTNMWRTRFGIGGHAGALTVAGTNDL